MSENHSIHEFDVNLIVEYFSKIERQGPGSPEITLKALSFIEHLSANAHVADLGCGSGGQTMVLAGRIPGKITGIDLFPAFVDLFNANAKESNLQERVRCIVGSMDDLPFKEEELDLIWCEGAIYNIGFEKGLGLWRKFLKKNGYVAISEASWFTEERPEEIEKFWMEAYPGIDTVANKVAQMQKAGYIPVATFMLPDHCWTTHFYDQQKLIQENFLREHAGNAFAENFVAYQRHEEQLFRKYHEYYGYVFYIGKKI